MQAVFFHIIHVHSVVCTPLNIMLESVKSCDELHNRGARGCETPEITMVMEDKRTLMDKAWLYGCCMEKTLPQTPEL